MQAILARLSLARSHALRDVLHLAWPILLSMLSLTVMGVVDTLLVGRLGTVPLAAVGITIPTFHLLNALGLGLMRAIQVVTAQRVGAGRDTRALGWQAIALTAALSLPLLAVSAFAPALFTLLTGDDDVAAAATTLFHIRVLGAPALLLLTGLAAWLQGQGDTRTPMRATLFANGVNVALDLLLIPHLGLSGAGWAFSLGQLSGALLLLWQARAALAARAPRVDLSLWREIAHIGAPNGVNQVLNIAAFLIFASFLARIGADELAAHVLVMRLISVSFLPGHAIGEASGVLVGQAVGARDAARARAVMRAAIGLGVGIMGLWGVVFIAAPGALLGPFEAAPSVEAVARELLWVAAAFQLFDAVAMVGHGVLDGAGDARFLLAVEVTLAWLVKLPLGWALAGPLGLGAAGAWWGLTGEIVLLAVIFGARIRSGAWMRGESHSAPA